MTRRALTVLDPGPLCTVQDSGRRGLASQGVSLSGAADPAAHALANRLVGNDDAAATLELTLGGLALRAEADVLLALAGARCPGAPHHAVFRLRAGEELRLDRPASGLRTYLAVRGGIDVAPVLGSRSTDLLSGIGPAPLRAGQLLPVGAEAGPLPATDYAPVAEPAAGPVVLSLVPGPRTDWFGDAGLDALTTQSWSVSSDSNRIGVRLEGRPVPRLLDRELPSEGILHGAVQIPASGLPVIFLPDHPVTGGYPVIGVVAEADLSVAGQLVPGQQVGLRAIERAD